MYETEEQEVEALKKWWADNGTSIIAGVVLGLLLIFGWRWWGEHRQQVAAEASNTFDQMISSTEAGRLDEASTQAGLIRQQFGSTPYAAFADLMLARIRLQQGDVPGAKSALDQASKSAPDPALRAVAVLRLARILLSTGDPDGAAKLLNEHPGPAAFAGEYALARGDIAQAKGDANGARSAFQEALQHKVANPDLVQLKLDNLPPGT